MANRSVKSFSTDSNKNKKPVVFEIDGESFEAKPTVPGIALMELVEKSGKGGSEAMGSLLDYLRKSMVADEYTRLYTYLSENDVDVETINNIISYLIEEQSARPTQAPGE